MSVVKKKKHVSKKNKKAWRKHCDITDVEAFLEDQRLEERLGKFETKPDSELFILDTQGEREFEAKEEKPVVLTPKQRKRQKLVETPKCFEVLLPSSKVEDPNKKRNHKNPVGFKPTALSKVTEQRRLKRGYYEKKAVEARKNRKIALEKKRKIKQIKENFDLDLWGEVLPEAKGIPTTLCDEFIPTQAQLHNVLPDKRLRPKPPPPKTIVTRAAVEAPHPGISYNPSYQEHQQLLQDVVQHEEKMIKREQHLLRVTNGMFSKVTQQEKENQWREEMSAGLPKPHDPAQVSDPDSDGEYRAVNPPVKNKKKDHKARRKQKERIAEKERLKREKIDKKKITDIYRLRKLQSTITNKEKRQEEERTKRSEKRSEAAAAALPALNKNKIAKKEPEFVDPELLSGDLRHINAKSNLLRDRYESLQRRGAVAGAKLMMKKRKKTKSYFKAGHKVTDQDVERYLTRSAGKK
ncbi:ribosome biogenesis protein NOP53 [Plodia interpunctella]|uniref:ribosome biogenesis protein NOP53 n=1 Tax=Plodia interpunctella TaxID=58824 RepID=UPI0023683FB8|nr:ribosome biogenesis protein NOP53 [Plodia interpunctella]